MFSFTVQSRAGNSVGLDIRDVALQAINSNFAFGKLIEVSGGKQAHVLGVFYTLAHQPVYLYYFASMELINLAIS
jgi:hypothetical protein